MPLLLEKTNFTFAHNKGGWGGSLTIAPFMRTRTSTDRETAPINISQTSYVSLIRWYNSARQIPVLLLRTLVLSTYLLGTQSSTQQTTRLR